MANIIDGEDDTFTLVATKTTAVFVRLVPRTFYQYF